MSLTIDNMATIPPITIENFTTNVSIFRNTRAVEIPDKLDAVANGLKDHVNDYVGRPIQNFMNSYTSLITTYVNDSVGEMEEYQNKFTNEMSNNISGYLDDSGSGYNTTQSRQLIETGNTGTLEFDDDGKVLFAQQGAITTYDVGYNSSDQVVRFKEKITIDDIDSITEYTVTYDDNGIPKTTAI